MFKMSRGSVGMFIFNVNCWFVLNIFVAFTNTQAFEHSYNTPVHEVCFSLLAPCCFYRGIVRTGLITGHYVFLLMVDVFFPVAIY